MIRSQFNNIKVAGIAAAVPTDREVIAEKFGPVFGEENVAKFSKTTGVVQRHVAREEQCSSDFAYAAAEKLLTRGGVDRDEIGICLFVTQTPDYRQPSTACVLHKRLKLSKDCICFDINLGCSGWVFGLETVAALMQSTNAKYGLLLVGDTSTKLMAPTDSSAVMLLGDSGSATLLEKVGAAPVIQTAYRTDGEGFKAIIIPAGAYRNQTASHTRTKWGDGNERSDYDLYMNGVDVFSFTVTEVPKLINEFVEQAKVDKDEIDCYALHQANCYILKQLVKKAKLDAGKIHISMDRYGNTSGTSIPLTICDKYGDCNDGENKKIFACGFGVGLSWGIATFEVNTGDICPIIETDDYFKEGAVSHE